MASHSGIKTFSSRQPLSAVVCDVAGDCRAHRVKILGSLQLESENKRLNSRPGFRVLRVTQKTLR